MGDRGRAYTLEVHAPDRVCESFEALAAKYDSVAGGSGDPSLDGCYSRRSRTLNPCLLETSSR